MQYFKKVINVKLQGLLYSKYNFANIVFEMHLHKGRSILRRANYVSLSVKRS